MGTFEEELGALEQILAQEILLGIEPPYDDQAKLSQVALRMRKSRRLKALVLDPLRQSANTFLFPLIYLQESKPLPRIPYKSILFLTPLVRYIVEKDESYFLELAHHMEFTQNCEEEINRMLRFVKILHGPTTGVMPGQPTLKYISPMNDLYILPERQEEIVARERDKFLPYPAPEIPMIHKNIHHFIKDIHQPTILKFPIYTFCDKMILGDRKIFFKWVDPTRVSAVDHEINIAAQLHQRGINVPTFYGYALAGDNAYLIAKAVEGVDFLRVYYTDDLYSLVHSEGYLNEHTYIGPFIELLKTSFHKKITFPFLKEKVAEAYHALGKELRKAVEAGLVYPDVALRNSMLTYEKGKPKITLIDFERTELKEPVTERARGAPIGTLGSQLASASFKSKQLYKGFWK